MLGQWCSCEREIVSAFTRSENKPGSSPVSLLEFKYQRTEEWQQWKCQGNLVWQSSGLGSKRYFSELRPANVLDGTEVMMLLLSVMENL